MENIILASSSVYRKALLSRLIQNFQTISPDIDETAKCGENAESLSNRLAQEKSHAIAIQHPEHWIIGSDQTVFFQEKIIGKPGSMGNAIEQLRQFSGQKAVFFTSLCLMQHQSNFIRIKTIQTEVTFRVLREDEIQNYLALDNPIDCAGSFKCESLGISLFSEITSKDPTALIGLPLISLSHFFREAGINIYR